MKKEEISFIGPIGGNIYLSDFELDIPKEIPKVEVSYADFDGHNLVIV